MIYGSLETEPKEIFSAPNTVWNKLCFNTSLRYFRLVLKRLCIVQLNSYQIHFMAHKTPSCDTIMLSKVFDITVLDLMILMWSHPLLGQLEGVGPENLDFFGPKWHSLRSL